MKPFFTLIFFSFSLAFFAQGKIDSITTNSLLKKEVSHFFTDEELTAIDSLLMAAEYNSPLVDSLQYVIPINEKADLSSVELSTETLKIRLKSINENTPFHLNYNPVLEQVIKSYLKYRTKYYPALMAKAAYYFPLFEKYLEQYDIPLEMKYLAIVESALNPTARSRVGARGLWQFMYLTGRQYDLKVSSYEDDRQDPVKSTIAACQYLSDLYGLFGDWDLALAAYNSGPGNVSKAIRRSGGNKNYWNLRPYLPSETAGYVPAFYATMYIFTYAKEHHIYPEYPPIFHFATDTIHLKKTVTFNQITEATGIKNDMLTFLNPKYKLEIIPFIKDKPAVLRIPKKETISFLANEDKLYKLVTIEDAKREKPLPKYFEMDKRIRYKVRSGDYLGKIAEKFGVRVSDIKKWNRMKSSKLSVGQHLSIYPKRL